ncbi:hypothetical protein [Kitasatospora sp. LaBMicrA B282]|uniref:hypothetical protein n=1 Tax=Kitasatospora sp. LaBMicrA B282 TaxID=3420949 RepID=UPI003D0E9241
MAIPELIPIAYLPEYRTAMIGHYDHGQFWASLTGAYPQSFDWRTMRAQWREHQRFYAVLHRFDHDGHHVGSDVRRAPAAGGVSEAEAEVATWLADLPGLTYGAIAVRPFRIVVDDVVFGLIPEQYTEAGRDWERVELVPEGLSFAPPWNGIYDT